MRSIRPTTTAQRRGSDSLTTLWHPPAAFLLLQGFWVGSGLPRTLSFLTGDFIRRPFLPIGCLFEVPTSAPHSGFILNSFPQSTALCFNPPSVFFPFPSLCSPSPFFNPSWIPASRTHTWIKKQSNQLKKERKKERNTALITKSSLSTPYKFSVLFQFYAPLCFLASGARGDDCIQGAARKAVRCLLPYTAVKSAVCCKRKGEVIWGDCC